jgi:type VI secretion system lysozyme-like protein
MATQSKPGEARASLFDRLVDESPGDTAELRPLQTLSREAFLESVRTEVSRLLNTRNTQSWTESVGMRSVLTYGVIDYTAFYPANQENRMRLGRSITQALATYEPRLARVRVQVLAADAQGHVPVRIDAMLVTESMSEPVSFPVVIRNRDAAIEVQSGE